MTRICVEYIVIDPLRMEDGQRLIILDELPKKWFNRIERLGQHDRGRLDQILELYKRYGCVDMPNYGHEGIRLDVNTFGCYTWVTHPGNVLCSNTAARGRA